MAPDTYAQFAYCVKWDGRYVAGFRHAYGLKRNTVLVQRRDGADSAQADALPLHSTAGAITLEDGVTCDAAFARWASGGAAVMPSREDVTVEVHNEASQLETAFKVSGCWVSQFRALPDLDANANAVSIQSLMLQHEGWERDDTVTEPAERGFALSERFEQAVTWVAHIHSGHVRKGSDVPYVSHLFAVSSLVLEDGGDENQAIAALLHDAVEDGRASLDEIRARFGDSVAGIVAECSDTLDYTTADDKPPWRQRKDAYIAHLADASEAALRVSNADKLHNARCLLADYRAVGDELWQRFNPDARSAETQLWYYDQLVAVFRARRADSPLVEELARVVAALRALSRG